LNEKEPLLLSIMVARTKVLAYFPSLGLTVSSTHLPQAIVFCMRDIM